MGMGGIMATLDGNWSLLIDNPSRASLSKLAYPQIVKMEPFQFFEDLSSFWCLPHGSDNPSANFNVVFWPKQTASHTHGFWKAFAVVIILPPEKLESALGLGVDDFFVVSVTDVLFYRVGVLAQRLT